MASKIRVGIVGATVTTGGSGWGANAHVPALHALPDFELKAVCTAHEDTAAASAAAFGAELAFHDIDAMAAHPDVDLVVVSVRVPWHRDLVMAGHRHKRDLDSLEAHMDPEGILDAALTDVGSEERALVLAAALDYLFADVRGWDEAPEKERALGALLLAGSEQLAVWSQARAESRTAQDLMLELLDRAKRAVEPGFPVLLPQGGTAAIGEHHYEVSPMGARLTSPGLSALAFEVKLTNSSPYDANFWNRTFRLEHGDEAVAPTNSLNEVVPGRTTASAEIQFEVPADLLTATLLIGDDAATAVALPVVIIPLSV